MKFIIEKNILLDGLNYAAKALSSKTLIPVLNGIKFDLTKEGLYLRASDTDISIQSFIPGDKIKLIDKLGSIVIQGKYIVEIIRKMPNTLITITVGDNFNVMVQAENSLFNLNGINPTEFPNLYLELTKEPIILDNKLYKEVVNQTLFATSTEETRPILTGLNFSFKNKSWQVLATDSYRLAKKDIVLEENIVNETSIVIPSRNLLELSRMIADEGNMQMHVFNNKVLFKTGNILFQSRLLSGTYPASEKNIPIEFSTTFKCNGDKLYEMIDRASLLTSMQEKNIINMELCNNELIIMSNSPEIGKVEEKMAVDCPLDMQISFSSKYMLDALKSFTEKEIEICMNNEITPIVIRNPKNNDLIQLILPIKTY